MRVHLGLGDELGSELFRSDSVALQQHDVVRYDVVWYGAVGRGVVRCGAVWRGVVRCGAVRCGEVRCGWACGAAGRGAVW